MRPSARIQTTSDLLASWCDDTQQPADQMLQRYLKERRYIGSKDRRAISTYFFTVIRHKATLERHVSQTALPQQPRSWLLASLILQHDTTLDTLPLFYDASPYGAAALSDDELSAAQQWQDTPLIPDEMPFYAQHNIQPWMEPLLKDQYGDECEALLDALQTEAPTDIRVNSHRASRQAVQRALAKDGIEAHPTPYAPHGLRIHTRHPLTNHAAFRGGLFDIQDEASQLAALYVEAEPGMTVIDLCAGAGGKTLAMADSMQGKGSIIACDIDNKRLERLRHRAKRCGVDAMIQTLDISTAEGRAELEAQAGNADRVVVDAPCSGSGTWRRNPHLRWQYDEAALKEFTEKQASILQYAAKLVQPSKRLIYMTCSLLCDENNEQIQYLLTQHNVFKPLAIHHMLHYGEGIVEGDVSGTLKLLPHRNQMDGFFIAILSNC